MIWWWAGGAGMGTDGETRWPTKADDGRSHEPSIALSPHDSAPDFCGLPSSQTKPAPVARSRSSAAWFDLWCLGGHHGRPRLFPFSVGCDAKEKNGKSYFELGAVCLPLQLMWRCYCQLNDNRSISLQWRWRKTVGGKLTPFDFFMAYKYLWSSNKMEKLNRIDVNFVQVGTHNEKFIVGAVSAGCLFSASSLRSSLFRRNLFRTSVSRVGVWEFFGGWPSLCLNGTLDGNIGHIVWCGRFAVRKKM